MKLPDGWEYAGELFPSLPLTIGVIVPTRERPANADRLFRSFEETVARREHTDLTFVLDIDCMDGYPPVGGHYAYACWGNMVERSNWAARVEAGISDIVGWAADDNVFETPGWDDLVRDAFKDPDVLMTDTNDLLVGDTKAGAFFVRSTAVKSLGYLFPPFLEHLYADFAVNELYKAADRYTYRSDIVIPHLHPYAGKAEWDAAYLRYNTFDQDYKDGRAYREWRDSSAFSNAVGRIAR